MVCVLGPNVASGRPAHGGDVGDEHSALGPGLKRLAREDGLD
jgi:hypothetical protein